MKVFSAKVFSERPIKTYIKKEALSIGWPQEFDGKPRENCGLAPYYLADIWFVDEEDFVPYKGEEK